MSTQPLFHQITSTHTIPHNSIKGYKKHTQTTELPYTQQLLQYIKDPFQNHIGIGR